MKPDFWRHVLSTLTGSVISQLIPICATLVIARQYLPSEFGMYAIWLGLVLFLSVVLTCRFETALAIEENGEPRRRAFLATLLISTLCAAVLFISGGVVVLLLFPHILGFSYYLTALLIPVALAVAVVQCWQSWAAAEGKFRQLSIMRITQSLAEATMQIGIGIVWGSAEALVSANLCGNLFAIYVASRLLPTGAIPDDGAIRLMRNLWQRHKKFPLWSLPADTINAAALQLPLLITGARFGAEVVGLLALTMKILGAPIALLGRSVLDVFKRQASESYRNRGECRVDYVRTFKVLALASLLFCGGVLFCGEYLFALAFGNKWRGAGTIAIWLLPLFALRFVASPLSYMVYIAGKQHLDFFWQIALLGMTVAALTLPSNYPSALQFYSCGYAILYAIYLVMSYQFSLGKQV